MAGREYQLIPTWIDPDVTGWELEGDARDCHATFDEDDQERDVLLAQAWANRVIGRPLEWRLIADVRAFNVFESYVATDG